MSVWDGSLSRQGAGCAAQCGAEDFGVSMRLSDSIAVCLAAPLFAVQASLTWELTPTRR